METVKRLMRQKYHVQQVCLMAAAIDDDSLSIPRVYRAAAGAARRVAVLASREDRVLKWAYPVGDLLQAFAFWRDSPGLALGYHGPRSHGADHVPVQVYAEQIPDSRKSDHGDYIPGPSGTPATHLRNQVSAASFANAVLSGDTDPEYT